MPMPTLPLMVQVVKIAYPWKSRQTAPLSKVLSEAPMSQSFTSSMEVDLQTATIRKISTKLVSFRWFESHACGGWLWRSEAVQFILWGIVSLNKMDFLLVYSISLKHHEFIKILQKQFLKNNFVLEDQFPIFHTILRLYFLYKFC